jgi:hypothetical protein
MTSFPTETIMFNSFKFNSEVFWGRLLSFQSHKFLMGASCPFSGDGLVGSHAYSILDVREISGVAVGRQARLTEFFSRGLICEDHLAQAAARVESMPWMTDAGTIRLLKLRNPWGCREWKGAFGAGSEVWTSELRAALGGNVDAEDGTFWISYHDFLQVRIPIN